MRCRFRPRATNASDCASRARDALVQERPVVENPASNGRVMDRDTALPHHLLRIAVAERIPEVPTPTEDDHPVPEMTSVEQRQSVLRRLPHPYQTTVTWFATLREFTDSRIEL